MSEATTILGMLNDGKITFDQSKELLAALSTPTRATAKRGTTRRTTKSTASTTAANADASKVFSQAFKIDAPYGTAKRIGSFMSALVHQGESYDDALDAGKQVVAIVSKAKKGADLGAAVTAAFNVVRPKEDAAK